MAQMNLTHAMANLKKAFDEVNSAFDRATPEMQEKFNGADSFPFPHSFDDVAYNVGIWVDNFISRE